MLLDDKGEELQKDMKKEDVLKKLQELAPQNPEEEKLLAQKIGQSIEFFRKKKINRGIETGFDGVFKENSERRLKSDGFSDNRSLRMIANIPRDMAFVAKEIWGDDVLTDPEKFRKAFVEDETGRYCLTVDPKTI